jgi:putative chitinase
MTIAAAITACASSAEKAKEAIEAWELVSDQLEGLGINNTFRQAMLIGQCAHESARFRARFENLNYSGEALWKIFRRHFASEAEAQTYHRQPERIANRVYGNRMDNGPESSGDGWRYRGRGYLQLTGKSNYRVYGGLLELDLLGNPDLAARPENCWLIAAQFCARTKRSGKTLLEWADGPDPDVIMVTKGINGGTHGLDDRQVQTARALRALRDGEASTAEWQALLLNAGFEPGPIDGLDGPKTEAARKAAEAKFGVSGKALLEKLRALE